MQIIDRPFRLAYFRSAPKLDRRWVWFFDPYSIPTSNGSCCGHSADRFYIHVFSTLWHFFIAMSCDLEPLNVSSLKDSLQDCLGSRAGSAIMTSYSVFVALTLLPLFIFIIYLGLQQWLQKPSTKFISHTDVFTFNMCVIELINVIGSILLSIGKYTSTPELSNVSVYVATLNSYGQIFFHLLTCLERYVAVVHPFTYRSLRKEKAIRIRNFIIVLVWLVCFAFLGTVNFTNQILEEAVMYCVMVPSFVIISFCNLSILYVLNHPRPGDSRHHQADQLRIRAFSTSLIITAVLLLKFGWDISSFRLSGLLKLQQDQKCTILLSTAWTNIPSSLVLPLLFLHRAGKLKCLKNQKG